MIRFPLQLITFTNCCKFSIYVAVLLSCRNLKITAFKDRMFRSANADLGSLCVEYRPMSFSRQKRENSSANSRPLSTQIFSGFGRVFELDRQNIGFIIIIVFELTLFERSDSMSFCNASLHSAAVCSFNGNAQTKRLSVSTATKMKLIPWLYQDNFCISAKSRDKISFNRKL